MSLGSTALLASDHYNIARVEQVRSDSSRVADVACDVLAIGSMLHQDAPHDACEATGADVKMRA
jgi:hypothetical protein